MPARAATAGPLVARTGIMFRLPDPGGRLAGVRLAADRGLPVARDRFVRVGDGWALRIRRPRLDRFEYKLELLDRDGECEAVVDPTNPLRAPGAFGEKSVIELPGYAPPAWLRADRVAGRLHELSIPSSALGGDIAVTLWTPHDARDSERLPLLVAHDGPELAALAGLIDYAAALIAAGRLPRHRVALLHPGDRDQWYSASALYTRALCTRVLPALARAVASDRPVGMGASLGGLAMLHAQRRHPDAFAALFLQSGSFFLPRFDAHEGGFVRYRRIVRFVRATLRGRAERTIPITLTCGELEENVHNNRVMAAALSAQGHPTQLRLVRDLHNYTAWRDAFDPHLTRLLRRTWIRAAM